MYKNRHDDRILVDKDSVLETGKNLKKARVELARSVALVMMKSGM